MGGNFITQHHQGRSFLKAYQSWKKECSSTIRNQPNLAKSLNETGIFRSNYHIASQGNISPCSCGNPVYGGDYWLLNFPDPRNNWVVMFLKDLFKSWVQFSRSYFF